MCNVNEIKIKIVDVINLKYIRKLKYMFSNKKISHRYKNKNKSKMILTLLPSHGNLGDHAIAYASNRFLKENFPNHEIVELDMYEIYKYGWSMKKTLEKDDFIVTIGGGNMNNLYMNEEWTRRFIIDTFKGISIVSLPQTMAFEDNKIGKRELIKSKKIYEKNKKLTIFAREDKSFEIMKDTFKSNRVFKNPDMVFYLENLDLGERLNRDGVLVCLRSDKESYIGEERRCSIISDLMEDYKNVRVGDTVISKRVNLESREEELKELWAKFFSSKVVITDRLHGMIFAVITKTPCLVIRNSDHKIIESYKWIKNLNYIRLIDDFSYKNIKKNMDELIDIKNLTDTDFKNKYFNNLNKKILKLE